MNEELELCSKGIEYIHQTPLSSCSVEGGSGYETRCFISEIHFLWLHCMDSYLGVYHKPCTDTPIGMNMGMIKNDQKYL